MDRPTTNGQTKEGRREGGKGGRKDAQMDGWMDRSTTNGQTKEGRNNFIF